MEGDNPYSTNIVSVVSNPPSSSLASSNILSDKIISTRGKRGGTGSSAQMPPPPPPPIKRGSKAIERFDATTGEVKQEMKRRQKKSVVVCERRSLWCVVKVVCLHIREARHGGKLES